MKRILAFLLVAVMLLSLCACAQEKAPEMSDFEKAESCIDKSVEELYELIGEPNSSDYAPSCLGEGGEDGNLYYDGFIVYTYKDATGEVVHYVEENEQK